MTLVNSCYMFGFLVAVVPLCLGQAHLTTLLNRIENLERRDMEQSALIDDLKQQVRVLNDKLHYLSTSKYNLQKQHAETYKKLASQEDLISALQKDLEQQKLVGDNSIQKTEVLQSEVQEMGAKIEKMNRIIVTCKNHFQEKLNDIKATKADKQRQNTHQDNSKENTDTNSLKLPHYGTVNKEPARQPSDTDKQSSILADKLETYYEPASQPSDKDKQSSILADKLETYYEPASQPSDKDKQSSILADKLETYYGHASQPSDKDELSSVLSDKFETYDTNKTLLGSAERKGGRKIQGQGKRYIETRYRGSKSSRKSRPRSVTNTVAFHAVLSPHVVFHLGTNDNIRFDTIQLNEGGGYHNQHGLFIAPKPGFYLFSVTIATDYDKLFSAEIRKNGAVLANIAGDGEPNGFLDQGSVTIVTKLNVGDEIWVVHVHPADGSIWGNKYSTFTGILIAGFE